MNIKNTKSVSELWAIVDKDGNVCMSDGGSSSKKKLLVYESREKAKRALAHVSVKRYLKELYPVVRCIFINERGNI